MVQILEGRPGIGARFAQGISSGLRGENPNNFVAQFGQMMQQRQQEQKQKQQMLSQQSIMGKLLSGETLSPEEYSQLPIEAQINAKKAMQPKAGSITGQPIPKEVSQAINSIISGDKNLTADELALELDEAGIPRAYSNSYIENRRRQDEALAKSTAKEREIGRKEQLAFHKETEKFDEKLSNQSEAAEKKLKAIENQRRIQPEITNLDRYVSGIFKGSRFENLLKSKSAQEFDAMALPMVEGQKETFGVRLSDADLKLILQKIATADKNPEANKAILDYMELDEKLKVEKRKIGDKIRKENKGLRPLDYENQIRERFNERFGDQIEQAANRIMSLPDNEKKNEIITGRKKVTPGTPLTDEIIDKYLDLAGNDFNKASQMAQEDGYQF